jgi:hypothetical protein
MDREWFWLCTKKTCGGICLEGATIVEAAPVYAWMRGRDIGQVLFFLRKQGLYQGYQPLPAHQKPVIFTIGYTVGTQAQYFDFLATHHITGICDVRSVPYSRHRPEFSRDAIGQEAACRNIAYIFMGKALGGRPAEADKYVNGRISFRRIARSAGFQQGLERLRRGLGQGYRLVLMCAEKDPINCHRAILICRHLRSADLDLQHIMAGGALENHRDTEHRLMHIHGIQPELFATEAQLIERAYDLQEEKIAHRN